MNGNKRFLWVGLLGLGAAALGGCIQSAIVPLRPIRTEKVVLSAPLPPGEVAPATDAATPAATEAATGPATSAATQMAASAPATAAATAPMAASAPASAKPHTVEVVVDPNQTTRYLYLGDYPLIWSQAEKLLTDWGYRLDEQDYRRGVLTTLPRDQSQLVEPWRPDQHGLVPALESTVNHQRITLRVTIRLVPNRPKFYAIAVQALVERESNPSESLGAPISAGSSAFGQNLLTLRSDYAPIKPAPVYWTVLGHDPRLEKRVLAALFKKI